MQTGGLVFAIFSAGVFLIVRRSPGRLTTLGRIVGAFFGASVACLILGLITRTNPEAWETLA